MSRRLRPDLEQRGPSPEGAALFFDPITGRELELSPEQIAIVRALEGEPTIEGAAEAAGRALGVELPPDLVLELAAVLDELGLLERAGDGADRIRVRKREARRRFFEEERLEKLKLALEKLSALPYYASVLPSPLPTLDHLDDLARLPRLDKATLRARFDAFLPRDLPPDVRWLSTSGTSGERQQLARSEADWDLAQTFTWTLNRAVRDVLGARYARLTTPVCDGTECHLSRASLEERTQGPRLALETTTGIASLPDEAVRRMVRELEDHAPEYFLADPSYLAMVVAQAERLRLRMPRVKLVVSSYELCSALHRRRIEEAFECPLFEAYGASELGAMALQCEAGRLHVNPSSYVLEVLCRGQEAPGSVGRVVVTSLDKSIMPLLRYDTGDLAVRASGPCTCAWAETDTLERLCGRAVDVLSRTDGSLVTPADVDARISAAASRDLVSYALVQEEQAKYRASLLSYAPCDLGPVRDALHDLLGPGASVRVERRRELLPAPSGKFRLSHAASAALRPEV